MKSIKLFIYLPVLLVVFMSCKRVKKEYYPDGSLKVKSHYKDKKLHGNYKSYFRNGKLKADLKFKKGKRDCVCKWYHKNGNLSTKAKFVNGKRKGSAKFFYKNRQLKQHSIVKDDSVLLYELKYDSLGDFQHEYRRIKVNPLNDTINNDGNFSFKIRPYGPTYHYDSFFIKLLKRNIYDTMLKFKNDFDLENNPRMRLIKRNKDIKFQGKLPPSAKWAYRIRAYNKEITLDSMLGYLPIKKDSLINVVQKNDSSFQVTYTPQDTGDHLLVGNYGLIPTDTAPVKSIQDYPFSVRFYVRPEN